MDASWFEPVRAYCERTGPGFWDEPLNALSNGAFLLAAAASTARAGRRDPSASVLAGLVALVGIGSFLFHTLADRWSMLADVIPIGIFIYAYFLLAAVRFLGFRAPAAAALTLLFAVFSFGLTPALDAATGRSTAALTNGSIDYLPAFLALVGIGGALLLRAALDRVAIGRSSKCLFRRIFCDEPEAASSENSLKPQDIARRQAGLSLLAIAALFLLSLAFRTVDRAICPVLPLGTHLLWHVLNAAVLYTLIVAAIRFRERPSALRRSGRRFGERERAQAET